MAFKATVTKSMAGGENMIIEVQGTTELDLERKVAVAHAICDRRLLALNKRAMAFNPLFQKLAKEHPQAAMLVHELVQVLTGQRVMTDEQYGVVAAKVEETQYDATVKVAEEAVA